MNKEKEYVKQAINNCFEQMAENPKEFFDNAKLQKKYNEKLKENTNLKQALINIRENIYKNSIPIDLLSTPPIHKLNFKGDINDILQEIVEVLGDDING